MANICSGTRADGGRCTRTTTSLRCGQCGPTTARSNVELVVDLEAGIAQDSDPFGDSSDSSDHLATLLELRSERLAGHLDRLQTGGTALDRDLNGQKYLLVERHTEQPTRLRLTGQTDLTSARAFHLQQADVDRWRIDELIDLDMPSAAAGA